jgi:hypothetical protein
MGGQGLGDKRELAGQVVAGPAVDDTARRSRQSIQPSQAVAADEMVGSEVFEHRGPLPHPEQDQSQ